MTENQGLVCLIYLPEEVRWAAIQNGRPKRKQERSGRQIPLVGDRVEHYPASFLLRVSGVTKRAARSAIPPRGAPPEVEQFEVFGPSTSSKGAESGSDTV